MAGLTGKLLADFTSFTDACSKAEVSLTSFQTGSSKVEAQLNRMSDSFSGQKIIQQATLMAEVFDRAGGSSSFTTSELARMGSVGAEAVAKLTALGKDVPPGIQRIADAADTTQGAFAGLVGRVAESAAGFFTAELAIKALEAGFHAATAAASEFWDVTLKGAAVDDVEQAFKRLTEQTGRLGDSLLGQLRAGTHETITDFQLMKAANQDLAAGMNLTDQQFGTLAKGAFALAQATGGDVKTALDTMNDAMLTGRTRTLALLTGKIDAAAAEEKYAATLGTTSDRLTAEGKIEAARVAILQAVGQATERLGEQTDGLDERVAQAQAAWGNFEANLGKTVATSSVLEAGMVGVKQALADAFGGSQASLIAAIATKVDDAAIAAVGFAQAGVTGAGFLAKEWYALEKVVGDVTQIIEGNILAIEYASLGVAKALQSITFGEASEKYAADVARINGNIDSLLVSMKKRGDALQDEDKAQSQVDATVAKYNASLDKIRDSMLAARTQQEGLTQAEKDFVGPLEAGASGAGKLNDELRKQALVLAQTKEEQRKFAEAMTELNSVGKGFRGTVDTIDGAVVEAIKYYLEAGVSLNALAEAYGLTAAQAKAVETSVKDAAAAQKGWDEINKQSHALALKLFQQDEETTKKRTAATNAQVIAELEAQQKLNGSYADSQTALGKLQQAMDALHAKAVEGFSQKAQEQVLEDQYSKSLYDEAIAQDKARDAQAKANDETAKAIELKKAAADAAKAAADAARIYSVGGPGADAGLGQGTDSYGNKYFLKPGQNTFDSKPTSLPQVAFRAAGGPVTAGQPYVVGEKRPELFVPSSNGSILPNVGGQSVVNHFYVNGTAADVARQVAAEVMRSITSARKLA